MDQIRTETFTGEETDPLDSYYRLHASIYDATRWSFLFGRNEMIRSLGIESGHKVLEIGCGTGKNLQQMKKLYPGAELWGIDLSEQMLKKAASKLEDSPDVKLIHGRFGERRMNRKFDLVICSYMLSMTGDALPSILDSIYRQLNEGGRVAVTDFFRTRSPGFENWMRMNHVTMDGSILSELSYRFMIKTASINSAYLGLWDYIIFTGSKNSQTD